MVVALRQSFTNVLRLSTLRKGARPHIRRYVSVAENEALKAGDVLHGFTLQRSKHVPELELTALQFHHKKSGADYIHIAKDDKNNAFQIGFKTNPPDHTGVPHILEHLTLCGSQKYPVRDPFFKMMPRSLNNFMNAMTYADFTAYPFATTNPQDFKNLMSVYLDATFHPLLREHDFAQEAWRLGPRDPVLPLASVNPVEFKGVVYNEMKGNVSNADYLFYTQWLNNIFPSINNSGGDPTQMTELTHEQLKKFQAEHYNPTNSKILTYGSIPVRDHLSQLGPTLDSFDRVNVDRELKEPTSLESGPRSVTVNGPTDPLYPRDQQYKASVSWIMGDTTDTLESFSLDMISSLLLHDYSSPIRRNSIEIGWGVAYTPNTGYDSSAKTGTFTVGWSGLKKADLGRMNDGLENTLQSVKRAGFSREKIEGRLHQIELEMKHKTAGFGMGILSRLQQQWLNGIDPFSTVAPSEIIDAFRTRIEDPKYLLGIFEKYLLNGLTLTFIMEPSDTFGSETESEESDRLSRKLSEVSQGFKSHEDATKHLESQEQRLSSVQEAGGRENIDCLPTLHVKDISRTTKCDELRFGTTGNKQVQWRETPTNGITYFRAIQTLKDLPDELRMYLPLFSAVLHRLGTKRMPTEQLEDEIRLWTGGIAVSHHVATSPLDLSACSEGIMFGGTALDRNVNYMLDLLRLMVHETNFNSPNAEKGVYELIKDSASDAINAIAEAGNSYAKHFAEAGLSPQARILEQTSGLTQMRLMMDLASRSPREGISDVVEKLAVIQSFMLSKIPGSSMRVAITCSPDASASNESALQRFLESLPVLESASPDPGVEMPYPSNAKFFFPLPYQVYYAAHGLKTIPYNHPDSAALAVLAQMLTNKRLHPEIREKGGAYGASSRLAPLSGLFTYSTYRDPNPLNSLHIMNESGVWARDYSWTQQDMDEGKLAWFQGADAPQSVNEEGMALFLQGVDDDMKQARRERVLDVTAQQVKDVADRYLVDRGKAEKNTALLGQRPDWLKESDGWTEMPMNAGEIVDDKEDGFLVL